MGWTEKQDIPELESVQELISFFQINGDVGLCDLEIEIKNTGKLIIDESSECTFTVFSKNEIVQILNKICPLSESSKIISTLLN